MAPSRYLVTAWHFPVWCGEAEQSETARQVRAVSRLKHYSIHTEQAYTDWTRRFSVFHSERINASDVIHGKMTDAEVSEFSHTSRPT